MSIVDRIKNNQIHLPIWIGQLVSYIPYSIRPVVGNPYRVARKEIKQYNQLTESAKKEYIFQKMVSLVNYAYQCIPFYHRYYNDCGFSPSKMKRYDDLSKIPIINKDLLLSCSLEERSNMDVQHYIVNTGGSSGKTLTFCTQRNQMAIESAHCHEMYSVIGYKPFHLKMSLVGRKTHADVYDYDFARHILFLNMYLPFNESSSVLKSVLAKNHIRYLQGYPSILSEFATYCHTDKELLGVVRKKLKGIILNSEYPYLEYVKPIEEIFGVPCLSFYGHTERCVLAQGDLHLKNKYYPFQTYGYTEAVLDKNGKYHLVGTSYYNYASPLIRYDTEDIISSPCFGNEGVLTCFEMLEGRTGQFIVDKKGKKVSLTGLIMGRHHQLFNYCLHLQVYQQIEGKAIIIYVPKDTNQVIDAPSLVDFSGIDIDFEFIKRDEPVRTVSGKVNLLVLSL